VPAKLASKLARLPINSMNGSAESNEKCVKRVGVVAIALNAPASASGRFISTDGN
jgi:hypothetical protein